MGLGGFVHEQPPVKKFSVPTLLDHKNRKQTKPKLTSSQLAPNKLIDLTVVSCHFFNETKHKTDVSFLAFKTKDFLMVFIFNR